jgi:hypothetical protein
VDFLLEIVFQFLFEIVAQAVLELGFRGAFRALRSGVGRSVVAAGAGFGFGLWWGGRLSDAAFVHRPRLLWVSVGLAVLALARAAIIHQNANHDAESRRPRDLLDPTRWPVHRLVTFAVLNLAIAAGIEIGFVPSHA